MKPYILGFICDDYPFCDCEKTWIFDKRGESNDYCYSGRFDFSSREEITWDNVVKMQGVTDKETFEEVFCTYFVVYDFDDEFDFALTVNQLVEYLFQEFGSLVGTENEDLIADDRDIQILTAIYRLEAKGRYTYNQLKAIPRDLWDRAWEGFENNLAEGGQ